MAPFIPEEVDLFTAPHLRMKELVDEYSTMLKSTNFTNFDAVGDLLSTLHNIFTEFKSHEQIENRLIMKKLKNKLKKLSIKNSAVCNCHKDDQLTEIMILLRDGYSKKTIQDRLNYGIQLKKALEDFAQTFLPHMKEEEEEFQPLLMKYFTYEELKRMKEKVMKRHFTEKHVESFSYQEYCWLISKVVDSSASDTQSSDGESFCAGFADNERDKELPKKETLSGSQLPQHVLNLIFRALLLPDLARCAMTCRSWNAAAYEPSLWKHLYPVHWAEGIWHTKPPDQVCYRDDESDYTPILDADADIDEAEDGNQVRREMEVLHGLVKYVLPRVGNQVLTFHAAKSKALTSSLACKVLQFCPNLEHLNLSYTRVSDKAFRSLCIGGAGGRLTEINLSGCPLVSDISIARLALALSGVVAASAEACVCALYLRVTSQQLQLCANTVTCVRRCTRTCLDCSASMRPLRGELECCNELGLEAETKVKVDSEFIRRKHVSGLQRLSLSGCMELTDLAVQSLARSCDFPRLRRLDLSGCMQLSGEAVTELTASCPTLQHEELFYCDNMIHGPFPETASACNNSDSKSRACCRMELTS